MARMILTQPGEDVDVGGDILLFGTTAGGEVITVLRGAIVLDASFNAGGDTVRLPDDAASFTLRLVGAAAIIEGRGVSVTIPVGSAGVEIAFNDGTRNLRFDEASSTVRLGEQRLTATAAAVLPFGSPPTLSGTEADDVINGTAAADVIDGLGGFDRINGGGGNDVLRGGSGGDDLDGSFGNDQLFGGPDADRLTDNQGATALLDGGTGNDWLLINNLSGTRFDLFGGEGDDQIEVSLGVNGGCLIDAGAGNDRVVVASQGVAVAVTLGAGRDQLVLPAGALGEGQFGVLQVSDFAAGEAGDAVELLAALSGYAPGWNQTSNPFSTGFLRLIERDGTAVLQVDRDGAARSTHAPRDLILFAGISVSALVAANLEGIDPRPAVQPSAPASAFHELLGTTMLRWEGEAFG